MDTIQAVIMGFVQGLSEFLPISSSGHIVITSAIYKLLTHQTLIVEGGQEVFFDISIHFATLLAILIFFKNEIIKILKGFFLGLFKRDFKNPDFLMGSYIIIATFFTGIIAILIKDFADSLLSKPYIVGLLLMVTGCVLYFSEKFKNQEKSLDLKTSILIGIAQGLAVFPGLSRSGLTISAGIFKGLNRVESAKFSFLLSAPIILLASLLYPLIELDMTEISTFNFKAILIGMLTAFISGYFCIKYFILYLSKSNLKSFAYYCWVVGFATFLLFLIFRHYELQGFLEALGAFS